jgi:hypothetical protein
VVTGTLVLALIAFAMNTEGPRPARSVEIVAESAMRMARLASGWSVPRQGRRRLVEASVRRSGWVAAKEAVAASQLVHAVQDLAADLEREPFDIWGWRDQAAACASRLGDAERAELVALLEDPGLEPVERVAAAELLRAAFGKEAAEGVLPAATESAFDVMLAREETPSHWLTALAAPHAALGSALARRTWLNALAGADSELGSRACTALAAARDARTANEIAWLLESDPAPEVAERALAVLGRWAHSRSGSMEGLREELGATAEWLEEQVAAWAEREDASPDVRRRAMNFLSLWGLSH